MNKHVSGGSVVAALSRDEVLEIGTTVPVSWSSLNILEIQSKPRGRKRRNARLTEAYFHIRLLRKLYACNQDSHFYTVSQYCFLVAFMVPNISF